MNNYYGLRLTRVFLISIAVVVSISTVATIGGMAGLAIVNGDTFDWIRALSVVVSGGILSLLTYSFGQLIDVNLKNYEETLRTMKHVKDANDSNKRIIQLLGRMHKKATEDEIKGIQREIEKRRHSYS